jgi:tetratricopeptide (TPR) repeat protein
LTSHPDLPVQPDDDARHLGGVGVGVQIGPYVVEGTLGRGGTARVLVVRDTRDGHQAAMKLLLPIGEAEAAQSRLRREFRALQRLQHPNLARVEEWGLWSGRPWFTMELVEGVSLREAMVEWAELEPSDRFLQIRATLIQTARALAYVHERGLIHRDVSPGNLLIRPDGVVKLTDFGLVSEVDSGLTTDGEILGTLAHTAPEQLSGQPIDGRADLYALGTVLYQALTGRKPFLAHTVQGWIEKHLRERPRPPHELEPLVPDLLDRVCMRLLEKDPNLRFASAAHLLFVLGDKEPLEARDRWPPRSVGRRDVKAWARSVVEDVAAGRKGAALLMLGAAGAGKTRLLDHVERVTRRRGVTVARGRCQLHDRPFGAFTTIFETLRGDDAPDILIRAFGPPDGAPAERYPVVAAMRTLIEQAAPCVILLDQVERADAATRELLDYLVRNTLELADLPVAFVLAGETSEGNPAPLPSLSAAQRHTLPPLTPSEVEELVLTFLPDDAASTALAKRLHAETSGSPAYLADMLRGLADEGLMVRERDRWRLTLEAADIEHTALPLPASLRAVLAARLEPIPEDAREIGRVLAIARSSLDLDTVVESAPFAEARVMDALDELVDAGIVVERRLGDLERFELSHARYRDVLLDDLTSEDRRRRHQVLGEIIERRTRHQPHEAVERLAWHFEQAGLPPKAYAYLAQTGWKHIRRGLHEEGLFYLDRALLAEPVARPFLMLSEADQKLAETRIARARCLYHLGRWDEALAESMAAVQLATTLRDHRLIAKAETRVGGILRTQSRPREARVHLETALRAAEEARDVSLQPRALYHLGAIAWGDGSLEEAERCWNRALEVSRQVGDSRGEGMAYNGLGILDMCRGRSNEARALLERSAEIFRNAGVLDYLAVARVNLIELSLCTGALRRALQLAETTLAEARELGHPLGQSLGLTWRARVLLALGRTDEARRHALEALRIATEIGTLDEQVASTETLIEAMLDMDMAAATLPRFDALEALLAQGDSEGLGAQVAALHAIALVDTGDPVRAAVVLDAARQPPTFPHVAVRSDLALARAASRLGRTDDARALLTHALTAAERIGYRWFALQAQHELAEIAQDDTARAFHGGRARTLAKGIAGSLAREDSEAFLTKRWGGAQSPP